MTGNWSDNAKVTNVITEENIILPANCSNMFIRCKFVSLDASLWDTSKVTNMSSMFYLCTDVNHIYVSSDKWSIANVTSSDNMFYNCTVLHNWNSSYLDKTYAIIDNGTNNGYLEEN